MCVNGRNINVYRKSFTSPVAPQSLHNNFSRVSKHYAKKEKDFKRSIGEEVEIHLYKPLNRQKEYFGILSSYDEVTVTIELEDDTKLQLNRKEIALIRLAFDF